MNGSEKNCMYVCLCSLVDGFVVASIEAMVEKKEEEESARTHTDR